MRGHVRQVYGFSVLNLFTNPMPGPYFRTNLLMATLLGGSSLHSLTHPFLPSLGLLRVLWMLLFHTLRRLNLTQQIAIPNYHLGAIMTSSGLKPPQIVGVFFVHHPMLCFCSFSSPICSTFFSCSGVLLGEHSNTAWSIANDGWNISRRCNHIQPEWLDSADSDFQ